MAIMLFLSTVNAITNEDDATGFRPSQAVKRLVKAAKGEENLMLMAEVLAEAIKKTQRQQSDTSSNTQQDQ
jgi:hypothetical protein